MRSAGKRAVSVFMAAIMMLMMVPLLGTQKAYAEELIDFGNSYNCDWRYFKNASGQYVLHIGNMEGCDGDMGNYKLNSDFESTAAWAEYREQVDELELEDVTNIGDFAFYKFTNISEVELEGVKRIGDHAFYGCSGLRSIRINGDNCVIEDEAFNECWSNDFDVEEIRLEGVKKLGYEAFGEVYCESLYLGEGLESIGEACFYCNERLFEVMIPFSCTSIDKRAFIGCKNLERVYINNPDCVIGEDALDRDYLKVIFGSAGSTAEKYANDNKEKIIPFEATGDRGTGTIDLSSGGPVKLDYPAEASLYALMLDDQIRYRTENDADYLDLDRDSTNDLTLFVDYYDGVSVFPLSERSVGGEMKFTLHESRMDYIESSGRPYYSTLVIKLEKLDNPMTVRPKTAIVRYSKLKGKTQTLKVSKVLTIKKARGTTSFKKLSGNKKITINKNTGKVTVKKGLKRGTYKIKVKVTAAGNRSYKARAKTVTFTIKVK